MAERYLSELRPQYRLVVDEPPPKGVKVMLKGMHTGAVIGVFQEGCQYVAWSPLPSFTPEQKERLKQIYYNR